LGINNGLRAGDLLKLKINDFRKLKPGQSIVIRESKTGKNNILMINKTVGVIKHLDEIFHRVLSNFRYSKTYWQYSTSHFKPPVIPIIGCYPTKVPNAT